MKAQEKVNQRIKQLEQELEQERKALVGDAQRIFSVAGIISTALASSKDLVKLAKKEGGFKKGLSLITKRMAWGSLAKLGQQILVSFLKK